MKSLTIVGLLAIAGLSVVADDDDWWQNMLLYQIYPRSFKDNDGDGIGDLPGIESKLEHLVDLGVDAFWISPIYTSPMVDFGYDVSNYVEIDSIFGTMDDFESMMTKAKSLGLKVILDFVPNHSSDQHEWFNNSIYSVEPYTDYYVWLDGRTLSNGTVTVPNNWVSNFGGSAWTWNDVRQKYYLHQFAEAQPDLNFTNPNVIAEMNEILLFWLDKGVDGFRVDSIVLLVEDQNFPDEPLSGTTNDSTDYNYVTHIYTKDQIETYEIVQTWRDLLNNYSMSTDNVSRIMMLEAYANYSMLMMYYDYGAHFPFNFNLINYVDNSSSASDIKDTIDDWMNNMPTGDTPNWVVGNHDQSRVATRFGSTRSELVVMMDLLLPGVSVIYNGEEIGMEDTWISWEDSVDPEACSADEDTYESTTRDPERTPYQWDNTTSAGFSTNESTWLPVNENYLTLNLAAEKIADVSYYKFYLSLVAIRNETVVKDGDLNIQVLSDNVLAFSRELDDYDPVIVVLNFGNSTETVSLDDFTSAPETMLINTTTMSSNTTAGTTVERSSLDVPALSGIVLKASDTSSASMLTPITITSLMMAVLVNLHL